MKQHGPWQIVATREVYRDPWIHVERDEVVRPDGQPGSHCVVRLKSGVSVLPLDEAGQVHLTEEFHYGVGRETIEVVSGGIEPGEDALETARRELAEELGIRAEQWTDLGVVDPFTSVVVSPTRLFLARGLTFGATACEGTERIRRRSMLLDEAVEHVIDGRITHGPSCVLILKTQLLLVGAGQGGLGKV
jgi:ADP-ribose pyrophosphatase